MPHPLVMSSMPRPRRHQAIDPSGENRKLRQVLGAARKLFTTHGFDVTSMDAIAREAGVSKATLYVHFASKDALLSALVDDECRSIGPQMLWQPDGRPIELEPALRAIARDYTAFFLDDRGLKLHRLVMSNAARFPKMAEVFMAAGPRRCEQEVATFLRAAVAQQLLRIPDIGLAATQFLSLVQGRLHLQWELQLGRPSADDVAALIDGGIRVFLAAYRNPEIRP
uniref:Regulatory protein TetR n=2 Tax=Rhodopseudomonas palustris TaxID=1076 RepID=E6VF69_RHOPX